MKYNFPLILLLLISNLVVGQKTRSKRVTIPEIKFPELSLVKGIDTYSIDILNEPNESYGAITKGEIISLLDLQSFKLDEGSPKVFFGIKGISHKHLTMLAKRNKATKTYEFSITPNLDASIKVVSIIDGVSTHYFQIPIVAKKNQEKGSIPEILTIKFEDEDYYLNFIDENKYVAKPALIDKYLVSLFGSKEKLIDKLISKIRNSFDLRVDRNQSSFVYLKDKKNPKLEEETVNSIIELEKDLKDVKNLDDLAAKSNEIKKFQDFWKQKLEESLAKGKSTVKNSWHITKNLYNTSFLLKDAEGLTTYYEQILDLNTKKFATSNFKYTHEKKRELLSKHIDASNGEIIYGDKYEVDPFLAKLDASNKEDKFSKENDLSKVDGYIITKDGEKIEGKISLRFSAPEKTKGSIVDVSTGSGKSLTLFNLNKKGKLKGKTYKTKGIEKFVIKDKIYEPVRVKKGLGSELDISDLGLNNNFFMELLYSNEKFKIYKDLMNLGDYHYKGKDDKKATVLNKKNLESLFGSCGSAKEFIEKEDFKYTDDSIISLAKLYAESCN